MWPNQLILKLPPVIWTKSNPQPWNTVKPNESTKLLNVNQNLDGRLVSSILLNCSQLILVGVVQLEER